MNSDHDNPYDPETLPHDPASHPCDGCGEYVQRQPYITEDGSPIAMCPMCAASPTLTLSDWKTYSELFEQRYLETGQECPECGYVHPEHREPYDPETLPTQEHVNGWACVDCLMYLANGETPPDWNEDETRAWLDSLPDGEVTLGRMYGEDGCECDPDNPDDELHAESCESTTFSWSSCDHCGSNLGGSRHAITFWHDIEPTTRRPDDPRK